MGEQVELRAGERQTESVLNGNGRVTRYVREGVRADQTRLRIEQQTPVIRGTLDGSGERKRMEFTSVHEVPEDDAWFVLQALADHYNMELTEK